MSTTAAPASPRTRHSGYAERLFEGGASRAAHARRGRPDRARRAGHERRRTPLILLTLLLALGLLVSFGMRRADPTAEQRPDPAGYRLVLDLVSIDRVGTMFAGTVSQGFFLESAAERAARIERLVSRVRAEGYESVYLFEKGGRPVASWNGDRLVISPDDHTGS